jgi:hypothetical protein
MKNKKLKILATSLMTITLCLCLMVGSTFAMFTAESSVNVAVSSAKVAVSAVASQVKVSSTLGTLASGCSATFGTDGTLNISNMVPGDVVTFQIAVTNDSTVAVKYNAVLKAVGDNAQLFSYLDFKINNLAYNGETLDEGWKTLAPEVDDLGTITVAISLPENVGNDAQGLSCSIAYIVQAIQSNVQDADIPQYFPKN